MMEDSLSNCSQISEDDEADTLNSDVYMVTTEHFPVILPYVDNTESWKPAVDELFDKLPSLFDNIAAFRAVMDRTYELIYYCPNRELSNLYAEFRNRILAAYPEQVKDFKFKKPVISKLFDSEIFPSFQDIDGFFAERNQKLQVEGAEVDEVETEEGIQDSRPFNYHEKVLASMGLSQNKLSRTIIDIYNFFNGVFPNVFIPHLFFPENLLNFWTTFDKVVNNDGPVCFEKRLLVGLLVSICYDCKYVYDLIYQKYESWGTSMRILYDIKKFPSDLKAARELIVRLTLSPFSLIEHPELVSKLLKQESKAGMSVNKILHIGMLVCQFSALCTMALSLQIQPEKQVSMDIEVIDKNLALDAFHKKNKCKYISKFLPNEAELDSPAREDENEDPGPSLGLKSGGPSTLKSSFASTNTTSSSIGLAGKKSVSENHGHEDKFYAKGLSPASHIQAMQNPKQLSCETQRFFSDLDLEAMTYPKGTKLSKFVESKDFNFWTDGVALIDKYLHDQVESLEREITQCTQMTFNNFGANEKVSTKQFRRAIVMYVKKIYGINHDDYDYRKINNLFQTKEEPENDKAGKELTTVFKNLIKKISIDPTSVGPKDYEDLSEKHPFFTHELTHIILLVCAAKTEATLCHLTAVIDKLQADDE